MSETKYDGEIGFLQKLDRILTADPDIMVHDTGWIMNENKTMYHIKCDLACCHQKHVTLNFARIKEFSKGNYPIFFALAKGLDYHELAHVKYTFLTGSRIKDIFYDIRYDNSAGKKTASYPITREEMKLTSFDTVIECHNILEDVRIENLDAVRYRNIRKYFTYTAHKFISKDFSDESLKSSIVPYVLYYGRKFIDRKIIEDLRKARVNKYGEDLIKKAEKIVDDYLFANDEMNQFVGATRLAILFAQNSISMRKPGGSSPVVRGAKKKENEKSTEKLRRGIDAMERESTKDESDDEQESDDESDEDDEENTGGKKAKKSKQGKSEQKSDESGQDVLDRLNDIAKDALEEINSEVQGELVQVNHGSGAGFGEGDFVSGEGKQPIAHFLETHHHVTANKIRDIIKVIRNGLEAHYVKGEKSGKLDIRAVMNSSRTNNYTRVFRKWKTGRIGKAKMSVSLILDNSGSMCRYYKSLLGSAWCLNKALESTGDYCQIIKYNSGYKIVKGFFEKSGDWGIGCDGNTYLSASLQETLNGIRFLKQKHQVQNHIVIVFTDGDFADWRYAQPILKKINEFGAITVLVRPSDFEGRLGLGTFNREFFVKHVADTADITKEVIKYESGTGSSDRV